MKFKIQLLALAISILPTYLYSQVKNDATQKIREAGLDRRESLQEKWNTILNETEMPSSEFEVSVQTVLKQLDNRNLDSAKVLIREIRSSYSEYWYTSFLMAFAFQYGGEIDSACYYYEDAYSQAPLNEQVITQFSNYLISIYKDNLAEDWIEKGLVLNDKNNILYCYKSILSARNNNVPESRKWIKKASKLGTIDGDLYAQLAFDYALIGAVVDANFYFSKALIKSPNSHLVNYYAALYYFDRGQLDKSKKYIQVLEKLDSDAPAGFLISGLIDLKENEYLSGIKKINSFFDQTYQANDNLNYEGYLNNELFAMLEYFEKDYANIDSLEVDVFIKGLNGLFYEKNLDLIDTLTNYNVKNYKSFHSVRMLVFMQVVYQKNYTELKPNYYKLNTYGPPKELKFVHALIGDLNLYYNPEYAYQLYSNSLKVDSNYMYSYLMLKEAKFNMGNISVYFQEQLDSIHLSNSFEFDTTNAILDLASVYSIESKSVDVIDVLDRWNIETMPSKGKRLMALALYNLEDFDRSKEFEKAYLKNNTESYYVEKRFRMDLYKLKGKCPAHYEVSLTSDVVTHYPIFGYSVYATYPEPYVALAEYYLNFKKYEKCDTILTSVGEMSANYTDYWNLRGKLKMELGNYNSALKCFNQSLIVQDKQSYALLFKAFALRKLGEVDKANDLLTSEENFLRNKELQKLEVLSYLEVNQNDVSDDELNELRASMKLTHLDDIVNKFRLVCLPIKK
ncbi:MAG: tetratricopeptide repeat protein [Salibacteraceae bacterium]